MAEGQKAKQASSNPQNAERNSIRMTLKDYYQNGAADKLAKRMTTIDDIERELDNYADIVKRETGKDPTTMPFYYQEDVYENVFGNPSPYINKEHNDIIQREGFNRALEKAIGNMSEKDRAAFVLANGKNSVVWVNLNPKDGSIRGTTGPYYDDVSITSFVNMPLAEKKKVLNEWRKIKGTMEFFGGVYSKR